ncbi:MAG TPA: protein translocase SEC61 complex subunit gamma [Candidatus Nanoarchaeia archaeon]|nr:protein translocase SEC61 complex subunit gamma [Candidatus Nanoarchaeia archaeon]
MNLLHKAVRFLQEAKRVVNISRKPSKTEFVSIMKVCAIGLSLMGLIGFAIQVFYQYIIGSVI